MPEIKVQHVVSCSSEDMTHKAVNLLKPDTYRKWKCAEFGEKQASVILQFQKAEQIHSIDIGNEGSAFVEVLVGNSTSACEQDFEVLLVSSFFMSPTESRAGISLNRVRMFGPDKLAKATLNKKWDRVKVICTQPYNKNLAYGLSFIRFSSPPEDDEKSACPSSPVSAKMRSKLGARSLFQSAPSPPNKNSKNLNIYIVPLCPRRDGAQPAERFAFSGARKAPRYLLDGPESSSEGSAEEEEDLTGRLSFRTETVSDRKVSPELPRKLPAKEHKPALMKEPRRPSADELRPSTSRTNPRPLTPDEDYGGSTDEDVPAAGGKSFDHDSGCDTEDELKRVQEHQQKKHRAVKQEESDPYAESTDENTDVEEGGSDLPIPELPDLFLGKHFLLYGEFPNDEHRVLTRYITAFNGALEEYMNETVNYVVTAEEWDDRFDEALMENSNLAFVKPRWVYVCNEKQKLVPHQPYVVVPQL
ncbi:DNA repair protein XRCC1 [Heterodontus francisci]|uniref:DNA repair protein XRCC1 n=1 Tax=Heterodontus francisci TaxID=7792 RepID=UPI00355C64D0